MRSRPRVSILALAALLGPSIAVCQSPAPGIYGVGSSGSPPYTLYKVSATTGAATPIGPISGYSFVTAIAFSPSGILYGYGRDSLGAFGLITINPSTGAATWVAGSDGLVPTDLAYRSDGVMLALVSAGITTGGAFYDLIVEFIINTSTGMATQVGIGDISASEALGLAFSRSDILFLADVGSLYTVNQSTGSLTRGARLAFDSSFGTDPLIQTMKFEPASGKLYAFVRAGISPRVSYLGLVDPSTGAVSRIGAATPVQLSGLAIPPAGALPPVAVPSLSNFGMLLLVVLLAALAFRALRCPI
jgi:hypothetical protein